MSTAQPDLPEVFARVMEAKPSEREALIKNLAEGDEEMRRELSRLVIAASHPASSDDPLSDSAIASRRLLLEQGGGQQKTTAIGAKIGKYTIERVLGEGGMGVVYLATQDKPERRVALKVLKQSLPSDRARRRFELEAETLGRLQHPGIAQIFEAGIQDGSPYFAMEFIDGEPINEYVKSRGLGSDQVLRLLRKVAGAVQHAHQQGVIHRDLKPANILVTESGSKAGPEPRVLDFGVAKLTESDVQITTMRTDIGRLIGTLAYMSPEQACGDPNLVDMRSDVYSLGVLAFELLTGRLPYELGESAIYEAVRIIQQDDPSRLSTLNRTLRGDIETIVATALEKDPTRRYSTPAAFADDITRYLENQPIQARPASTWYQLQKFSRRNRTLVGGVAVSFVIMLIGLIGISLFAFRADNARRDANKANLRVAEALAAEQLRSYQLESVSEFQQDQLSELDAMTIGLGIRKGLSEQLEHDEVLQGIDFTGLAMDTLNTSLFEPSRRAIESRFEDQPVVRAKLMQSLAQSAERVGLLELSESIQRGAAETFKDTFGENDANTIHALSSLGLVLTHLGRLDEAEAIFDGLLDRCRDVLGNDHSETLLVLDNYGLLLSQMGRFDEAEAFHRESLEAHRFIYGDEHERTLAALNNMGGVLEMKGLHADAEPFFRLALEGSRAVLGNDHPRTLSSTSNLGINLKQQNKLAEAESYYQEVLKGRQQTLGNEHPHTVRSLNNLGGLYRAMNQPRDAERVYREALELYKVTLGENHPETVIGMSNLGTALRDQGLLEEAESLGARSVAAARVAFPPGHWITAAFLGQHATTLLEMDRYEEAAAGAIEGYELMCATYGSAHPRAQGAGNLIVQVHEAWHEAEPTAGHDKTMQEWSARLEAESGETSKQ